MNKHSILFFIILTALNLNAQTLEWSNSHEFVSSNIATKTIETDSRGNVYTIGRFWKTVDFDGSNNVFNLVGPNSAFNGYILKTHANGSFAWVKRIYSNNDISTGAIDIDNDDNIYITGSFSDTIDLDPGTGVVKVRTTGQSDNYIIKLDSTGNYVWGKTFGGSNLDMAHGISVSPSGDVYTTGYFTGTSDFNPGTGTNNLISNGSYNIFIQKLNSKGEFVWAKSVGSTNHDYAYNILVNSRNQVYVTGGFAGNMDFDPGAGTANLSPVSGTDVFVLKLDSHGNYRWAKSWGSTNGEFGQRVVCDDSGNVYSCGSFYGTIDFNPGAGTENRSSTSGSFFINKLDSTGGFKWVRTTTGSASGFASAFSIDIDHRNAIYLTGSFGDTIDFDPEAGVQKIRAKSGVDGYLLKLNSSGQFEWVNTFPGKSTDVGKSVAVDALRNVLVTGDFSDTIDFGSGKKHSTSNNGCFIVKYSQCNIYKNSSAKACRFYKSGNKTYTQSGLYNVAVAGPGNCDTIFSLNLTITKNNPVITQVGNKLSANIAGATYKWLNCNSGMQAIASQTNKDFTPVVSGKFAVAVTFDGCTDTSACFDYVSNSTHSYPIQKIAVYPNPNTGTFEIDGIPSDANLKIFDIHGSEILSQKAGMKPQINLASNPQGMYILVIYFNNQNHVFQVLKQ